jgi:hypothetical protein
MAIKHIILLFVETPRTFITAKLSIRKPESLSVLLTIIIIIIIIISADKYPGLRIDSFAVINLRAWCFHKQ